MANFDSEVNLQPSYGFTKTLKPKTIVIKMGDGYERRTTLGLPTNQDPMIISVDFNNLSETDSDTIETFLAQRVIDNAAFDFTPPNESSSSKFVYEGHSKQIKYPNRADIKITMRQVFQAE
tara:strand:- start:79 stop:441 length:363 start_codon:yes stop_codon:yes gene_type:complete